MALLSSGLPLAIVGAGPAGLTAAIASAQRGLTPTVVERVDTMTPAGGGIVVHSNGLRVLERLGLLESFKPMMFPCRRLTLQLGDRHELVNDYGALPIPHNYFAVVLRYQLQDLLFTAARNIAPIHLGRRCVAVEEFPDHVQLRFDSGEPMERTVVIGADGVHSRVRDALPVRAISKAAGDAYLRGISEQVRVTRWYSGRTFLIGDAAHAMTPNYGQGANAAMVDAVVLSALLTRGSIADVGRQYESIRRRFVDRTQTASWQIGVVAQWTSPMMRLVRDSAFRALSRVHFLSRRDLLLAAGYNAQEYSFLQSP